MPVRLNGSTSGYVELAAPAVAGTTSLELPTDSIKPGLVLVAAQSFSAASSVSVNNCFTATYDNYLVQYDITASSTAGSIELYVRLRASGTDLTSTYLGQRFYGGGTSVVAATDSTSAWHVGFTTSAGAARSAADITVYRPALAAVKVYKAHAAGFSGSLSYVDLYSGFVTTASAYDGLTLYPSADNITGTIRIYGIRSTL